MSTLDTKPAPTLDEMLNGRCVYCGKPAEGNYSIHREQIWDRIAE